MASHAAALRVCAWVFFVTQSDVKLTQVPLGSEIGPLMAGQSKVAVMYEPGLDQAVAKGMNVGLHSTRACREMSVWPGRTRRVRYDRTRGQRRKHASPPTQAPAAL
jgi:hypothetical protein